MQQDVMQAVERVQQWHQTHRPAPVVHAHVPPEPATPSPIPPGVPDGLPPVGDPMPAPQPAPQPTPGPAPQPPMPESPPPPVVSVGVSG
jgi:hypothetical protein